MAVFTISRETGSEGEKLGVELAEALEYEVLDKEIIRQVAEKIGASPEEVEPYDERAGGRLMRFLASLFRSHPEMMPYYGAFPQSEPTFAYGVSVPYLYYEGPGEGGPAPLSPEKAAEHFETIIRDFAGDGNVVIVGRGSQCILRETPGVVHLRTVAPLDWRVRRVLNANRDFSPDEAREFIERNDTWRRNYISAHYEADWDDPSLYHLVISMDRWDRADLVSALRGTL
ncbi:MAG: cytidylate kinase-like family protein [Planctomycetes bacterium]|nr:cytidylate kinase-like family protein [Planctomycetota bacterium]